MLNEMSAGVLVPSDVIAVADGDWSNALLIVIPDADSEMKNTEGEAEGDSEFITHAQSLKQPRLAQLAKEVLEAIRQAGVPGELRQHSNGRWVNHPLNSFTLKIQPRKGDIQFTLYGNPSTYDADDFLKKDQNSYSRGWIANSAAAGRFAQLAKQAHDRRA